MTAAVATWRQRLWERWRCWEPATVHLLWLCVLTGHRPAWWWDRAVEEVAHEDGHGRRRMRRRFCRLCGDEYYQPIRARHPWAKVGRRRPRRAAGDNG